MSDRGTDFKIKKDLYSLYYELTEIITKHQIEITKEEFNEKIESITTSQLSNYIKSLVLLVLKKVKEIPSTPSSIRNPHTNYESVLRHLEKENRNLYQQVFELQFQLEIYQSSLEDYIRMEEEFEEMKQKLKYEGGKFLENDRKDNEILILRAENTKLKNLIKDLESTSQINKQKQKEQKTIIEQYKQEISTLKTKLQGAENELNLFSNISININNNNELSQLQSPLHSNKASAKNISIKKLKGNKPIKQKKGIQHRNNSLSNIFDNHKMDIFSKYFTNKTSQSSNKKQFADTFNANIKNKNKNDQKGLKIKKVPFLYQKLNHTTTYGQFKHNFQIHKNAQKNIFPSGNQSSSHTNNINSYINQQVQNQKEPFIIFPNKHNSKISTQRQVRNNSNYSNLIKNNYKYVSASFG